MSDKFRLEKILKLKKYDKELWERKLSYISNDISKIKGDNINLREKKISINDRNISNCIFSRDRFFNSVDKKMDSNNELLKQRKKQEKEVRKELNSIAMYCSSLESLEEKHNSKVKKENSKKEVKKMGELAINYYFRNRERAE